MNIPIRGLTRLLGCTHRGRLYSSQILLLGAEITREVPMTKLANVELEKEVGKQVSLTAPSD